jgi:hypothetical protein
MAEIYEFSQIIEIATKSALDAMDKSLNKRTYTVSKTSEWTDNITSTGIDNNNSIYFKS